ncbi:MAG: hypothetical protein K6G64_01805 [Eubacterium sp.]|nr:hypothetical protein [Eubacterium sp.]
MDNQEKNELTPKENQEAKKWCTLSLLCMFGVPMISLMMDSLASKILGIRGNMMDHIQTFLTSICIIAHIAAWGLMISVRVRYPQSTMGKVLMWLYIVMIFLAVILFVVFIVLLVWALGEVIKSCGDACEGCGEIG